MNALLRFLPMLLLVGCATLPPPAPPPEVPPAPSSEPPPPPPVVSPQAPAEISEPQPAPPADPHRRFVAGLAQPDCADVTAADAGPFTPRHVERVLSARGDLFNYLVDEFASRGLPTEFAVLPLIESAYQPDPGNRGEVRGLWQFSTGTARHFGLRIVPGWDERLSAPLATDAAIRHLGHMWQNWQDWRLAAIGFNAGEYAVSQALKRHPDHAGEIVRLGLPRRALTYAKRVHALACTIARIDGFNTLLKQWANTPLHAFAGWKGQGSLDAVANQLRVDPTQLRRWNPLLSTGQWRRLRDAPLLLPAEAGAALAGVIEVPVPADSTGKVDNPLEHRVRPGDSLWRIAREYGLSIKQLTTWNRLDPNIPLRIGQRIRLAP